MAIRILFGKKAEEYKEGECKKMTDSASPADGDLNKSINVLMPVLAIGVLAAIWLGWSANAVAGVLLWVVACLATGATLGFLFGIPKSAVPVVSAPHSGSEGNVHENTSGGRPNTNLEEVSDWLTKIIVGLSLVHLKDINAYVAKISQTIAASLGNQPVPTPGHVSVAMAMVIGFLVLGFLFGYLYTRLFLQGAFQRSDSNMHAAFKTLSMRVLSSTGETNETHLGEPVVPTEEDRKSAQHVLQVAPADDPEVALAPLRSLAAEYEQLRRDTPYGNLRTRKMAEIAKKMTSFGLLATRYLPVLTQSPSPGERLAAIIALQMRFDPTYIDWLAERLVVEPAFPGYQAASAFLARLPVVGREEAEKIQSAVRGAVQRRIERGIAAEKSLDELCERILSFGQ